MPNTSSLTTILAALEREHGTAALEQALTAFQTEPGFAARRNFLHRDRHAARVVDVAALARAIGTPRMVELADQIEADPALPPMETPLPGCQQDDGLADRLGRIEIAQQRQEETLVAILNRLSRQGDE